MYGETLELPLAFYGHVARLLVNPAPDGGWDVTADVDGREIACQHCGDWRRVERFRARMAEWLGTPGANIAADRERRAA